MVAAVVNKGFAVVATNVEADIAVAAVIGVVVNVKVAVKGVAVVAFKGATVVVNKGFVVIAANVEAVIVVAFVIILFVPTSYIDHSEA